MATTADKRGYVANKYALDFNGSFAGWLHSAEGGTPSSEVVTEKLGPDHVSKKHITGVKYDDITVTCGTGMSNQFYQWIADSFAHKYSRRHGAIIRANYNFQEMTRINFKDSLITEVGLPGLDASSKDAAKMSVKWHPETTRMERSYGTTAIKGTYDQKVQKAWLTSNFRINIDGLNDDCARVNKIEALVVKQKNIDNPIGQLRDYEQEPASVEFPNLILTLPESHADNFYKWFENFVIKGVSGDDQEKTGHLDYLSNDLTQTLFTLNFQHLGVFKITQDKMDSGSDSIARVKVEMYCESMDFKWAGPGQMSGT